MVVGVLLGKLAPVVDSSAPWSSAKSQINAPIALLIWLMIYPMMLKIDFGSIVAVRQRPRGILVTLFVNWMVKPFSMAAIGYLFFRVLFQPWIGAELANQYLAGSIILAAAPCTAMVFVWSYLTDGDPAYTLVQVSLNDLIMLVLFAPIVGFLVTGASTLTVPFQVLLTSVAFIVILALGSLSRVLLLRTKGRGWFGASISFFQPITTIAPRDASLIFAFRRQYHRPLVPRSPDRGPDLIQVYFNAGLAWKMKGFASRRGGAGTLIGASNFRAFCCGGDYPLRPRLRRARHRRRRARGVRSCSVCAFCNRTCRFPALRLPR